MSKQIAIDKFYNSLGISTTFKDKKHLKNETLFNLYQKPKKEKGKTMPYFENNVANAVQQADILYLPDDKGFKFCLVVVDVADHKIDAQPLKTITAEAVLTGFKTIYKRKFKNRVQYLTKWKGYDKLEWTNLSDLMNKDNKVYITKLIKDYLNQV